MKSGFESGIFPLLYIAKSHVKNWSFELVPFLHIRYMYEGPVIVNAAFVQEYTASERDSLFKPYSE